MREIWKPVVLLIVAVALVSFGATRDPDHPTCGGVPLTPGTICETEVKGTPQQRTYSEVVAQTRAWQIGAPIAGGVIALAGAGWIALLLRRRRLLLASTPDPPTGSEPAPAPHPEPAVPDHVSDDPPQRARLVDSDPTRSPWAPGDDQP